MNILITNDDGFFAQGINLLYDLLKKEHDVTIVAPKTVMSAKSVSIILGREVEVTKENDHLFVMEGTPADCVAFGLSSLNKKFDLVISGINHGLNISYDTMYSGTVGAGLQALTFGVPAVAFSCHNNFDIVEKNLSSVLSFIKENNLLSKEYLLNVNFPLGEEVKEIRLTHIHYRNENEATYYIKNPTGLFYATRDIDDDKCLDENSDAYCVYHSIISITKIKKKLD